MRLLSLTLVLALALVAAGQQQPPVTNRQQAAAKQQTSQSGMVTFKTTTNLVIVNVTVRDKSGKPIEGLKPSDFSVLEDDKPQKISVFEYQHLDAEEPVVASGAEGPKVKIERTTPAAAAAPAAPKPPDQISTSANGEVRYKDRRLIVLYFDFASMPPEDQLRAQTSAQKFLREEMTPADLVAIMAYGTTLKILSDFTDDRDQLDAVMKRFRIGEASELAIEGSTGDDTTGEDTGAAFTADDTEFNIFNTDQKLAALETAAKMLRTLPEKKAFVYISSGVPTTGVDNQAQLKATINAAVRSNISFYPIDARGLVAEAPAGNANTASQRGTGILTGAAQNRRRDSFNRAQDTLTSLASDTGGRALLDNNELDMGIVQAQKDINSYYIVGYYSTNPALDGKFRRIKVRLNDDKLSAKLEYRTGYFASKEFKQFNSSDKETQLAEAIALGDPITDLTVALEVNYFRLARDRYFVPVAVKIPGGEVELIRKGGAQQAEFDFIGQVRDKNGRIQGTVRDGITVKLTGENADQIGKRQLQYDTAFTLTPGDYTLKFLTRENTTGKIGTFETKFTVPDLVATPAASLLLSSVVWANQRVPLSAAVGVAERDNRILNIHPLVQDGQKLIPSITKVFRKNQELYVYAEVYDPSYQPNGRLPQLAATLSFFRGRVKAFESKPVLVTHQLPARFNAAAVQIEVPLAALVPGQYTAQLNLIDEAGQKFAFRRSPLILLP
jgi:VWFA-related protein